MEIKNFIKTYDDVLPLTAIATLVKWANKASFQDAGILLSDKGFENGVQKNVRNTKTLSLNNKSSSLTNVHYCMLVGRTCMDGELMFRDPNGENEMAIKPKSSRLIIWPSSFMYPHTVKPVIEGTRYSVVAWAV